MMDQMKTNWISPQTEALAPHRNIQSSFYFCEDEQERAAQKYQ